MTTIDDVVQALREGRITLEPWQIPIADDLLERHLSDQALAARMATDHLTTTTDTRTEEP